MVIVICGLPGSGKSYFASHLAQKLGAKYINSDQIRLHLFPVRKYNDEEKFRVYQEMIREMELALQDNQHVVVDGTFYRESLRLRFKDVAHAYGEKLFFIEVWAEEDILKERLGKHRPYSEADYAVHLKIKELFEPIQGNHLRLQSTATNIDQMLEKALNYLHPHHE